MNMPFLLLIFLTISALRVSAFGFVAPIRFLFFGGAAKDFVQVKLLVNSNLCSLVFPSYWDIRIRGAWSSLKLFVNSNLCSLVFPSYWGIRICGAWSSLTLLLNSHLWGLFLSFALSFYLSFSLSVFIGLWV